MINQDNTDTTIAAVTHLEIPVLEPFTKQIADFYNTIFGWQISYEMMPQYGMTTNTADIVSVGFPIVKKIFPIGNIYIHVDDIVKTLSQITELGGEVVEEKNKIADDIGFGATFRDLCGNTIGLFATS